MTEEAITVRSMTASDLEFAQVLTDSEGWDNSARDWERLYSLNVGLVAEVEGAAAGVCTANDYGERWLDQVLTEEYSAGDRFDAAVLVYEAGGEER